MDDQPNVLAQTASTFFYDGASMRQPVPGDGKGILFRRGNVPTTTSFHQDKILKYPDGQLFDVIANGTGLMAGYRWPIPPADRWAIVAYARELERKRLASAAGTD